MIPFVAVVGIRKEPRRGFRLWIPLVLVWLLLLPFLLLLLPFATALFWFSLPYVSRSWAILERSRETSGLPLVFLLKTLIPVFAVLLALQGLAQAARAAALLAFPRPEERGEARKSY